MNAAEKETKIINLSVERFKLYQLIKNTKPENAPRYMKRIEKINRKIEELIKCK